MERIDTDRTPHARTRKIDHHLEVFASLVSRTVTFDMCGIRMITNKKTHIQVS